MTYDSIDLNSSLRVVIYNRCSTEELAQVDALERQVEYSRDYCLKRNWIIVHQYVEAKSGTSAEHRYEYRLVNDGLRFSCSQITGQIDAKRFRVEFIHKRIIKNRQKIILLH